MSAPFAAAHFILYVRDQRASADFYAHALGIAPRLDVPGMTEFALSDTAVLGLMPEAGIRRLLGDAIADPASAHGAPRAELYVLVADVAAAHARAIAAGATELSPPAPRDWGHEASYLRDPDGHVLAFARAMG
ncbi:MAG: VOC family protein [Candidatus Eisenbacteria bacterium]|nr:VOC family protein [Candidatus Eisenbacteria bacterium]